MDAFPIKCQVISLIFSTSNPSPEELAVLRPWKVAREKPFKVLALEKRSGSGGSTGATTPCWVYVKIPRKWMMTGGLRGLDFFCQTLCYKWLSLFEDNFAMKITYRGFPESSFHVYQRLPYCFRHLGVENIR